MLLKIDKKEENAFKNFFSRKFYESYFKTNTDVPSK